MEGTTKKKLSDGAIRAFSYILHNQPTTRADICSYMGIGTASLAKYINELIEKGFVKENGVQKSTGGRKPILYAVSSDKYSILCINISTIYTEVAICDFSLKLKAMERFDVSNEDTPDSVVDRICTTLDRLQTQLSIDRNTIIGAGVVLFGQAKDHRGIMFRPIIQYMNPSWIDYPVIEVLENKLGISISSDKGITATATLEYNYGKGKNYTSLLYILSAMSVRSAFVINGVVQSKSPFYEDAFGHMVINYDGPKCQCGQYGCLNCYASIPPILQHYRKKIKRGDAKGILEDVDQISIEDLCEAAEKGDECASSVIKEGARMLGIAMANYVNVTRADNVIIAGILAEQSQLYYDTAVETAINHLKKTDESKKVEFQRLGTFRHPLTTSAGALVLEDLFGLKQQ